jgi:DNA-binding SARP family transcriptional activator
MLHLQLLGTIEVRIDGRLVEAPARRRAWSLLAWLALHPGLHGRGELAARFWPDVLDQSARASLRSALWALRRALGPSGDAVLVTTGDRVGIDPRRPARVDALEFARLAGEGRLEEAVALCHGPLLPGLDEDWAMRAADEHRERLIDVLERLAAAAEERGALDEAVRLARRQTALDPLGEEVHRRLMRRLALAGDRPAALEVYARLVDRLRRQLRLAPSAMTRALAAGLRDADRAAEPARPSPAAAAGHTPARARRPAFVGRELDLARLAGAWRSARAGAGAVVAVTGEAGIGKTRLVTELLERARSDGARVAASAALDLGGSAPFGLWAELVRELAGELDPPEDRAWPAELARLVPSLEGPERWGVPPRAPDGPELARARLHEAMVALAEWAARDRPLLLVMEDLHGADGASLELAGYVARRIAALPVLIVLSTRDVPARAEVDALLAALRARGVLADELALGELAPEAIGRLVRTVASLDAEDVLRVVEASEGNPLLAVESARALAAGEHELAAGLHGAVRVAARSLGQDARTLTELVAVAGRGLEAAELAALPLDDPVEAASAGIASGLLADDQEGRVGYRHALLRDAVYGELSAPRRASHHATVAAVLARPGADGRGRSAEIAHHLRLAGRDDLAVERLARAAAEAQAVGALGEAVAFLEEAAGMAPEEPGVLLDLAEAHAWKGDRAEAGAALGRALERIAPGDAGARLDAKLRAGRWYRGALCDPGASLDAYRAALELAPRAPGARPGIRAEAMIGAAWCEAVAGDLAAAERLLSEVDALLAGDGVDPSLRHEAEAARGHTLLRRGRFVDAAELLVAAGEEALRSGRPDLTYDCWINAAIAMACEGRLEPALALADRAVAAMRESGFATLELDLLAGRAHILARLGRHDEATAAAREQRELAQRLGDPVRSARADHDAGLVALAAGDRAGAEALLADALAHRPEPPIGRTRARIARAEALIGLGRHDEAEAELDAATLEPLRPSDFPDTLVARLTRVEGLLAAARGDRPQAVARLEEAAGLWRRRAGDLGPGDQYMANLVDLGRAPVLGLVEPGHELRRVEAELAGLLEPAR